MSDTNLSKRIDEFYIQCTNNNNNNIDYLAKELSQILLILSKNLNVNSKHRIETKIPFSDPRESIIHLYRLIGQTRDIYGGRGEYTLAYMMIWEWYKIFPQMAMHAFYYFVIDLSYTDPPYGSWKDMKYMCSYVLSQCNNDIEKALNHHLVKYSIDMLNSQLKRDEDSYNDTADKKISLVSKWIPREARNKSRRFKPTKNSIRCADLNSSGSMTDEEINPSLKEADLFLHRFNWLYEALATDYYFSDYLYSVKNEEGRKRAINKCKANYRILCSRLNRHLDTIQIKQCGGRWSEIDHAKTTAITMSKQFYALSNLVSSEVPCTKIVRSVDPDRIQCAKNFCNYLEKSKSNIKSKSKYEINDERYLPLESYARSILYKENECNDLEDEDQDDDDSLLFSINLFNMSNNMLHGLTSNMCIMMILVLISVNIIFLFNILSITSNQSI